MSSFSLALSSMMYFLLILSTSLVANRASSFSSANDDLSSDILVAIEFASSSSESFSERSSALLGS
jgi:hypothetical protein